MDEGTKFSVFMAVWIAFGLGWFIWERKATPSDKKRLLPYSIWIGGVVFGAGVLWLHPTWETAAVIVPAVALISFINSKLMRACDSCGKLIYPTDLSKPRYCSKCGAELSG
jgi:hypothetical protein